VVYWWRYIGWLERTTSAAFEELVDVFLVVERIYELAWTELLLMFEMGWFGADNKIQEQLEHYKNSGITMH